MQVILAFAIVIAIVFILGRLGDHNNIKEVGGIRKKYNDIFSFFYNLPNSRIGVETKSFVTFYIVDYRCKKSVRLNYYMDHLSITCKVVYSDDTAYNNGTKYEWEVYDRFSREHAVLEKIKETFANLP